MMRLDDVSSVSDIKSEFSGRINVVANGKFTEQRLLNSDNDHKEYSVCSEDQDYLYIKSTGGNA